MKLMKNNNPLPELLSPAGSYESLRASLAAGADAVYFGATAYSNRMRAQNFTNDNIRNAIKLCHDCGARAHITVNTRLRDNETDGMLRLCDVILGGNENERCDAVIVADFGVAAEILKRYPHAVLHASTQTSHSSPADCDALAAMGFSRIVLPRELSCDEIKQITAASAIETEIFIHGAHCVSLSGQCLMSYVLGGRSGNRGECAQPCRLPFDISCGTENKIGGGSPLSLADMCLAGRILDILSCGVSSLKIEGRLKSPAYVYGVTKIYRTLLDERRNATVREITELKSLFSRGFADGYFTRRYQSMAATPSANESAASNVPSKENSAEVAAAISKRIRETHGAKRQSAVLSATPLAAHFICKASSPAAFTLSAGGFSYTSYTNIPDAAQTAPLNRDSAAKNLTKFGGTGYSLAADDIIFDMDDGLFMPPSALNDLRRRALDGLIAMLESENNTDMPAYGAVINTGAAKGGKILPASDILPQTGTGNAGNFGGTLTDGAEPPCNVGGTSTDGGEKDVKTNSVISRDADADSRIGAPAVSLPDNTSDLPGCVYNGAHAEQNGVCRGSDHVGTDFFKSNSKTTFFPFPREQENRIYAYPAENRPDARAVFTCEIADFSLFMKNGSFFKNDTYGDDAAEFLSYFGRIYVAPDDIPAALDFCERYEPLSDENRTQNKVCAALPVITPDDKITEDIIRRAVGYGVRRFLCHTAGQIRLVNAQTNANTAPVNNSPFEIAADASLRFNITNTAAADAVATLGAITLMLSPEIPSQAAPAIASAMTEKYAPLGIPVYGALPIMTLARCIICGGVCKKGNAGGRVPPDSVKPHHCLATLRDRMGEVFPVIAQSDCTNIIYNSTPVWMGDRLAPLMTKSGGKVGFYHFIFTTEALPDAARVVRMYKSGKKAAGRRI